MNPELPYLRKTALFNDETEVGLRGFEQVREVCEKAFDHFNRDPSLVTACADDLMRRLDIRVASNLIAAGQMGWSKFKNRVAEKFPEPPTTHTTATDFLNTFMLRKNGVRTDDEIFQAGYWLVQLVEERCKEPVSEDPPPTDLKKPVTVLIKLIDGLRLLATKVPMEDPAYRGIVEQVNSDLASLPILKGFDLMGGKELVTKRGSLGVLSLVLGDFFDGARRTIDAFNGSYSLDDTSALILLISDDLLGAFNEPEPNIEVIAKLTERLKDVEYNFMRLKREAPVIGTKSLDPIRSKAGGERTPWHVPLIQELINRSEPGLSWDLIFRRLSEMGSDVPLPEIESISCVDDKLVIAPSDKSRKPAHISRRTLGAPTYKKPKR